MSKIITQRKKESSFGFWGAVLLGAALMLILISFFSNTMMPAFGMMGFMGIWMYIPILLLIVLIILIFNNFRKEE